MMKVDISNQETLFAMKEVEQMKKYSTGKGYSSFSELLDDLDNEEQTKAVELQE